MLGPDNVSNVALESFGNRFHLTATLGKLANIAAEIGQVHRTDEGVLKAFVSRDPMFFDRKGIPGIHEVPTARLVFAINNRPRFADRTMGIWRRVVIIPFRYQVPKDKIDRKLAKKLKQELPGILTWASGRAPTASVQRPVYGTCGLRGTQGRVPPPGQPGGYLPLGVLRGRPRRLSRLPGAV